MINIVFYMLYYNKNYECLKNTIYNSIKNHIPRNNSNRDMLDIHSKINQKLLRKVKEKLNK